MSAAATRLRDGVIAHPVFAMLIFWLAVRLVQVFAFDWGETDVVKIWAAYARMWSEGQIPYVDFHPEYPPAALLLFRAPYALAGGGEGFAPAFVVEMMLCDFAIVATFIAWWLRTRGPLENKALWIALCIYIAQTFTICRVLYSSFDLAVTAAMFAAVYFAYRDRFILCGFLFACAVWIKLWPALLAPVCLVLVFRRGGLRSTLLAAGGVALGTAASLGLFLPRAGAAVFSFLDYHSARGLHLESTWANVIMVLHLLKRTVAQAIFEYGGVSISADAGPMLAAFTTPVLLLVVLLPQLIGLRLIGGARDRDGRIGALVISAAICGMFLGSKIFSPHYLVWLTPFLLIACSRWSLNLVLLAVGALTAEMYYHYGDLMQLDVRAIALITARSLLLLGLFVWMLRELWRLKPMPER